MRAVGNGRVTNVASATGFSEAGRLTVVVSSAKKLLIS